MNQLKTPDWVLPQGGVDEVAFARTFLDIRKMVCVDGAFFTRYGREADMEGLRREIYIMLSPFVRTGISRKVDRMLEAMKMESYRHSLPLE